ncbi:MAG: Mrp/NBP35 family ATP-binding protein [Planctomycetes bacterium]|nr:Mrp/NBP35 family ATP-binding protein [Planctomycetota bacterium]
MSDRETRIGEVNDALRKVKAPETDRDIVSLGWVKNVTECDGAVKAEIEVPMPGERIRASVQTAAASAIEALSWPVNTNVKVGFRAGTAAVEDTEDPLAQVGNVLAVASGKGGVGKSTVAVNLAAALARDGASVGILDADIYGPSIPTMLGATDKHPQPVDAPDGRKMFGAVEAHGMKLMSMGFMVEQDKPIIWRGPMLHGALKQFFGDVAWGPLDFLVIDLPPGTGDVALTMAQSITLTGAVVVSTPQEVAMVDARKAVGMFDQTGIHLLGVVENMAGEIFGEGNVKNWAEEKGHPFLGSLPLIPEIRISGDAGTPAALSDDDSVATPFRALADRVATACAVRNADVPRRKKISLQG